jgi:hypothetical protein
MQAVCVLSEKCCLVPSIYVIINEVYNDDFIFLKYMGGKDENAVSSPAHL